MAVRVGINGFGRIGRLVFRVMAARPQDFEIVAINERLDKEPALVNTDPYGAGWMIKVKVDNASEVQKLLSVEDYLKKTGH